MILPLRTYLFQILFLFSSIAIEGVVFHRRLNLSRRVAIEYSTSLNLFTTVVGWLIFFEVQALLPAGLKAQLISLIFYSKPFPGPWTTGINSFLILAGLGTFFLTTLMELSSLTGLEILLEKRKLREPVDPKINRYRDKQFRLEAAANARNRTITIFIANACSYSVILLVLLIRAIE